MSKRAHSDQFWGLEDGQLKSVTNHLKKNLFIDEEGYIAAATLKPNADAYVKNKFNQMESDKQPSNRLVPDTRHVM